MLAANLNPKTQVADNRPAYSALPLAVLAYPDRDLVRLLSKLSPDTLWGDRKIAAQKLGTLRRTEALPGLLAALPTDPFWMVRCEMIQALEKIGDPGAVPTLQRVAKNDSFQVVRSYAAKAVKRLSQPG